MWFLESILLTISFAAPGSFAGDPQAILNQVETLLQKDPANPRLLAIRGVALGTVGRDREGLISLDKSLAISPKYLVALEGAAEIAYRTHSPTAKGYLDRILDLDQKNVPAHGMLGALAFEARDCGSANQHFASARAAVQSDRVALAQWGECLVDTNQLSPGIAHLRESLSLQEDPRARYDLAFALHRKGEDPEALRTLEPLRSNADVEDLRGLLYAAQGQIQESLVSFRKSIELAPRNEQHYIDFASMCLDHQSFDVAEDVVNTGIANIPDSAGLYTLRGAIAAQTSDVERSAADFEHARRLQPDRSYADVGLSLLLRQQDQIDQAVSLIRKRLKQNPDDATLNFLLADLLTRNTEQSAESSRQEAQRLLETAIRFEPGLAKAHAALGKLLLQSGDAAGAVVHLKRALALDATDRVALNQYILALRKLNRNGEAAAEAQRLREVLAAARNAEVENNRFRLVRLSPANP